MKQETMRSSPLPTSTTQDKLSEELSALLSMREENLQDFTEALPPEMSLKIFGELDVRSLCQAALTSKQWNRLIETNDYLWRNHCLTVLAVCCKEVAGDRQEGLSWKVTLVRNYQKSRTKRNWIKGRYSHIRSADEIPPNSMYPFDVETWGEILEAELER
ncbi:F-box only protein 48 [Clupea harengus]|uniref:F-box only protein 48 n=1 Tax=Clupea harengus TaxID=7950 RepID=A0A6P3VYH8_CLUHA|nr:F-box only protein 48 [Clupea harengus]